MANVLFVEGNVRKMKINHNVFANKPQKMLMAVFAIFVHLKKMFRT